MVAERRYQEIRDGSTGVQEFRTNALGMCLASYGPTDFGRYHSVARSGQESIVQGLPWVTAPTRINPEGANGCGENRLRTLF
jgi:hypothetical protein